MSDCFKCTYMRPVVDERSPRGRGVCEFGGRNGFSPKTRELLGSDSGCGTYDAPKWCPLRKEGYEKETVGCFGCKSLFVCDERFRCNRRLFMDTLEGPSGFLEVDNVLKAAPEWCPGKEEEVDGS